MARNMKKKVNAKGKMEAGLKKEHEAQFKKLSPQYKKKLSEDFEIIDEFIQQDPDLCEIIFETLKDRINSPSVTVNELSEYLGKWMGRRSGGLLFELLDMQPFFSNALLNEFNVSQQAISWLRRCFYSFGPALSQLVREERYPEDWLEALIKRFHEDGNNKIMARVEIKRVDGQKLMVYGSVKSLFSLGTKLVFQCSDAGKDISECDEDDIEKIKQIIKQTRVKKTTKKKATKKKSKGQS